ncbi:MAG TPA: DUF4331 family protein, partial [Chthoniobacterales bacterium]|nr:DUF4331 family protein [Chthoniobacterales bacterium]
PSIGPNLYNFDPNVHYNILVATGDDLKTGKITYDYQFEFKTTYKDKNTIAISFLGAIANVGDSHQNLVQTYTVTRFNRRDGTSEVLGKDLLVPPNNQGVTTPAYNIMNNGDMFAKPGVTDASLLDTYTSETIFTLKKGYMVYAGQRDDGFYANIQSIFDLDLTYSGPETPLDSQAGFNVHTIVLNIPVSDIGGDQQIVGVWATTSRKKGSILRDQRAASFSPDVSGYVQVGRQGNPLFCEALIGVEDKNLYNETPATEDAKLFQKYALAPELTVLLGDAPNLQTGRTDIAGIFIPDLIKVDLSTGPAHLADNHDSVFNRLSIFGGDILTSKVQKGFGNGVVPGGWPNGRRFGDDVVAIAVIALKSDLRTSPPTIFSGFNPATFTLGGVNANDITYNAVFPFAATPHNGRENAHHTQPASSPYVAP